MTLQSQKSEFTTDPEFGRRSYWSIPPVARYPDWANPYAPFQTQEAYAAAWWALRVAERRCNDEKSIRPPKHRDRYIAALSELSPQSVPDLAEWCGVSTASAGAMMVRLERDGIVRRERGTFSKDGRTPDLWFLVPNSGLDQ